VWPDPGFMNRYEDPEHINVGTGSDLTIKELAETVKDIVFPEANLVFDQSKPDGTPQKLLDLSRLTNLGWEPRITFSQGIRDTYNWYLAQTQIG
jgi:GDP-L-fucose synthase